LNTILKNHNYSKQVLEFKDRINKDLRENIKNKFNSDIYIQTAQELETIIKEKNIEQVIFPYITVGHENDFIKKLIKDFSIVYQVKDYDKYCWQFSTKGYFFFKEQIPKILTKFL
jgi:deoxyribodipyrimidine photo-lyase